MAFFEWLEYTRLAVWVGESLWGYPIMISLHAIGLGTVVGILVMLDLRILGSFDGMPYGSTTPTADPIAGIDRFFIGAGDAADAPYMGLIDDFQIYNRALSAEEVLWNAGVTTPIDKPF